MAEPAELKGTTSARARRWLRRTAALLTAAPLLTGVLQIPAAPGAHAQPAPAQAKASGSRTVDVSVDSLTPTTPSKDDTLTVRGTVTNRGDSTINTSYVGLRVGQPMNGRNDIDTVAKRNGYSPTLDGTEVAEKYEQKIGKLPVGISRDFTLSIPVKELHLGANGVYQIGVSLTGQTKSRPWPQVMGIQRTFLPWQQTAVPKKSKLTYLWPLISTTHLTARTGADEQQTPIFQNDDLAAELAPGGRLQQLVALGKNLPVTWVIDPDLLATVEAMTKRYEVQGQTDEDTTEGRGQAVAMRWLNDLEQAVQGRQVVALPFADPDLASLAHRGKNVTGALSHLQSATALASTTVDTILHVKPRTDFAWPVNGAIDSSIVDVATSAGAHNIIARSDSLRETGDLQYTPTAARQIGGGNTAVVADARLSTAFTGDMTRAENATLAIQRFLAQSQMLTLQAPDKQRSVVVAPQRMPTATQAQAMAAALGGLSGGRWTQPASLGGAAKAQPDPRATQRVPAARSYPAALRRQELPTDGFRKIQQTQSTLDKFEVILTAKGRVVTPFGTAIMREMSTSWRTDPRGSTGFRDSVQAYLQGLTEKVRLVKKTDVTLSGRSATIPVTVQNNLLQPVELRLVLRSQQGNRLAVSDPQVVTVQGGHTQSVKFGTTANANGRAWVTAQLYTVDDQAYGPEMSFKVNVTEITSTVILVIAGGVLLLVLAGIRIYLQRKRSAARSGEDGAGNSEKQDGEAAEGEHAEPDEGEPARALVPGQPSDPAPDTGSQSADPSGSGEKVER
ncbi:DUF6049 family protein [Streptomyces sparsogenes]|uniref:DUF6049 family protein n=1 Tax=Streptomyces sparsogenes TaxID=67365 RepID=UPI0033C2F403